MHGGLLTMRIVRAHPPIVMAPNSAILPFVEGQLSIGVAQ